MPKSVPRPTRLLLQAQGVHFYCTICVADYHCSANPHEASLFVRPDPGEEKVDLMAQNVGHFVTQTELHVSSKRKTVPAIACKVVVVFPTTQGVTCSQQGSEMSGFSIDFVGFHVGKFTLPDKRRPYALNRLSSICRECRVFPAEERRREIRPPGAGAPSPHPPSGHCAPPRSQTPPADKAAELLDHAPATQPKLTCPKSRARRFVRSKDRNGCVTGGGRSPRLRPRAQGVGSGNRPRTAHSRRPFRRGPVRGGECERAAGRFRR